MHAWIGNTGWKLSCTKAGIVYSFSAVTMTSLDTKTSKTNVFIWQISWERTLFKHVLKWVFYSILIPSVPVFDGQNRIHVVSVSEYDLIMSQTKSETLINESDSMNW